MLVWLIDAVQENACGDTKSFMVHASSTREKAEAWVKMQQDKHKDYMPKYEYIISGYTLDVEDLIQV